MGIEQLPSNKPYKDFGNRLKKRRKEVFKTQEDFADAMSPGKRKTDAITRSIETIRNWEQGRTVPEFETLIEISEKLDCSLDYLLGTIDFRNHDFNFINNVTGLSETAICILQDNQDDYKSSYYVSKIIEHPKFYDFIKELYYGIIRESMDLLSHRTISGNFTAIPLNQADRPETDRNATLYSLSRKMSDILEAIIEKEVKQSIEMEED